MATWASGTFSKYQPEKKPGNQPGSGGEDGEKGNKPGDGAGEGKDTPPGKGQGKGQGDGPSQDDLQKEIEKKMGGRDEASGNPSADGGDEEDGGKKSKSKAGQPGSGALTALQSRQAEIDNIVPTMNWRSLIKLMVSSSVPATDLSYAKPSRRSATGVAMAAELGAGAVKPGERITEDKHNKLVLVFDTSGSMWGTVPRVMAETQKLLTQMGKSNFPITVVFFASGTKWFNLNIGKNEWYDISGASEVGKAPPKNAVQKDWSTLLKLGASGGTEFEGTLVTDLNTLAGQGYNIMIFSDSDLLYGNNFVNLSKLYLAHKQQIFWICDGIDTFRQAVNSLGQRPKTFSHFN